MNSPDFVSVTELPGDYVSKEQIERIRSRYCWASNYCQKRDVLEAACGGGQGLGILEQVSRSLKAGDFSEDVLETPHRHYGNRVNLLQFDASELPFSNNSLDVVILFEAIYYLRDAKKFALECERVLRPGGHVLIATANPDLFDFNPSPHTSIYFGVTGLRELFEEKGFSCKFYGDTPLEAVSLRQKILRPIKTLAVSLGLMPKSKRWKLFMKRFVFGGLTTMPAEIVAPSVPNQSPSPLAADQPDYDHKVILCAAEKSVDC